MHDFINNFPVTYRTAKDCDRPLILHLEEITMRAYAEALWGNWKPSSSVENLNCAGHFMIDLGKNSVGCYAIEEDGNCLIIKKLYIDPPSQRKGLGAKALKRITSQAKEGGLRTSLSVLTTNPAKRFYEREGFSVLSQTAERIHMIK